MAWNTTSNVADFNLSSGWYGYEYPDAGGTVYWYSNPSTGSTTKNFSLSAIPNGSTISAATLTATLGSPYTGAEFKRVDGTSWSGSINVLAKLQALGGDYSNGVNFSYTFKANGDAGSTSVSGSYHSSTLGHDNNTLSITYTPPYTAPSVSSVKLAGSTNAYYVSASSTVSLSWTGTAGAYNAISSYSVYRSVDGGAYALLSSGITGTSLNVTAPTTAGHKYQYYMVAIGEFSNGAATYSPQLFAYSSPTYPNWIEVNPTTAIPDASVTLSWSGAVAGTGVSIASYSIQRATSPTGTYSQVATSTATSKVLTAPSAGTYYYKVQSIGSVTGYNSGLSTVYATLTVQNPKSTLSLNKTSVDIDGSTQITATINASNSSYTHTVKWYVSGTYNQTNSKVAGVTSDVMSFPLSWNGAFPTATSGTATCTLTTFSGATNLGTDAQTFTVNVPASVLPSVSLAFTPHNAFGSYYLKGISSVTATATANGIYGSTIQTYSVYGGGYTGNESALTTGILSVTGTNTFTASVLDSRARQKTATANITVTNYDAPVISSVDCYRSDASGNPLSNGTKITVNANLTITALTGNSIVIHKAQYREHGTSTWGGDTNLTSGANAIFGTLAENKAYDVLITLSDSVGKVTTYQDYISPAARLYDFKTDRAAVGQIATTANRFQIPNGWKYEQDGTTLDALYAGINHNHDSAYARMQVFNYPSNTGIGVTMTDTTTLEEIVNAMPYNSILCFTPLSTMTSNLTPAAYRWGSLEIVKLSNSRCWATFYSSSGGGGAGDVFRNYCYNGVAGSWQPFYTGNYKPTPADIGAATSTHSHTPADIGAIAAPYLNGYYGLAKPNGDAASWIRTSINGIIPYQSGGHGSLGTSAWPFNTVYSNAFYEGGTALSSKYLGTSATASKAHRLSYDVGWGNNEITAWQSDQTLVSGHSGWSSYLIASHGAGASYYHQIIALPFWGPPKYQRMESGVNKSWENFYTTENLRHGTASPSGGNPGDVYIKHS